jgi:hypothetical protein
MVQTKNDNVKVLFSSFIYGAGLRGFDGLAG